jgi:hypothetical protein
MEETLVFIEENQTWIYVFLGIVGIFNLRLAWKHYGDVEATYFSLERERARGRLMRSGVMLVLVIVGITVTFVVATFASPSVPLSARPTPMPTVSLLTTPGDQIDSENQMPSETQISESADAGCQNADATISSPQNGDTITGRVEITGAANIPGFAFFKIEVRTLTANSVWRAISAGTEPVCQPGCEESDLIGVWDTSLVSAGEYQLQLVVMDTAGNAPMPCLLQVRVQTSS